MTIYEWWNWWGQWGISPPQSFTVPPQFTAAGALFGCSWLINEEAMWSSRLASKLKTSKCLWGFSPDPILAFASINSGVHDQWMKRQCGLVGKLASPPGSLLKKRGEERAWGWGYRQVSKLKWVSLRLFLFYQNLPLLRWKHLRSTSSFCTW